MRTDTPIPVRLDDYVPFPFEIDSVRLDFDLDPRATRVDASMDVVRKSAGGTDPFVLDGENLKLGSIRLDGRALAPGDYELTDAALVLHDVPDRFCLETSVTIDPSGNTALSGLYMSGGRFCTQCEATGFRRITFWPDRPDVMSRYTVSVTAGKAACPVLLSNGSPAGTTDLPDGRHQAVWEDPHRKPSYLFALCAGAYDTFRDTFTTASGREVALAIHVDPGEAPKAAWAMDCLKRAMAWDEEAFGREYDLDVFNIVAVRDFNFGAMENKGLNVFNSAYVLADEASATDADFEAIESIVAHEYFHNWTGNRITCRDWFQLCLKEGLTVFRDQEFSADMRSRPVQRIKDVIRLRARQFPEDAGPLAHPVRPSSYGAIDNLYTATVYEKGAELIRMLKGLIGPDAFARGMDLYFTRHDGTAATIEDFYACFEEASGEDLSHFRAWYSEPGTPRVTLEESWDAASSTLAIALSQARSSGPSGHNAPALPIPLASALLDGKGGHVALPDAPDGTFLLRLDGRNDSVRIALPPGTARPLLSAGRGFSAPVILTRDADFGATLALAAAETDPFNRWDLLQGLARQHMLDMACRGAAPDAVLVDTLAGACLKAAPSDPAFAALFLRLPDVAELMLDHVPADPVALAAARRGLKAALAVRLAGDIARALGEPAPAPFRPDAAQAGQRALRAGFMDLAAHSGTLCALLPDLFAGATCMTEQQAALSALVASPADSPAALSAFYRQWRASPLVIDKWFAVQARHGPAALSEALTRHADFDLGNPNRVRSVAAVFATQNLAGFHAPDGSGHRFLADIVRQVDPRNPALAARLLTAFEHWRSLEPVSRESARNVLESLGKDALSQNARDIVARATG